MARYIVVLFWYAFIAVYCTTVKPKIKFSPEIKKLIRKVSSECYAETGVDAEVFRIIEAGGYRSDNVFKKLIHCMYAKAEYLNEDGTVNVELDAVALPEEYKHVAEILRKCVRKAPDPVESVFQYFKCYQVHSPATMDFCFDENDPTINHCIGHAEP